MEPLEDEVTFFVYSDEFFFAAEELEKSTNPGKVAAASYYLYGHSLELAYKSYLYKNGLNIKQLKKIGHNLEEALRQCIDYKMDEHLEIDKEYMNVVSGINKYYSTKEFEYMRRTEKTFPNLWEVKSAVRKTINSTFSVVTSHLC